MRGISSGVYYRRIIAAGSGGSVIDCVFCRIVARQTAADIEYEDEHVMAFKDIYPKAPVHLLIVPKRHIASIAELKDDVALGHDQEVHRRLWIDVLEGHQDRKSTRLNFN